jgi:hypothetical protein
MKDDFILNGIHYQSGSLLREEFGIVPITWYKMTRREVFPKGIRIGRERYFPRAEFEIALSRGED